MISPSMMLTIGTAPASGSRLSCMLFTAPQDASVVAVVKSMDCAMPKRTSLPSMLPPDCSPLGAFERRRIGVGVQVLRHALPNEHQREDDRDGQQDVENAAGEIDPEIADRLRRAAGKTAHQRHRERDARSGGDKVVHREPGHL